ncbi:MAG: hypothetical protein RIR12_1771 [Bacteroidota bacterium]|jgi:hypothetical protein
MTYEQIHNLFKQRYNQSNWKQFLGEAFANSRLLATAEILTGIDSNVASQVQKLGYITLNENGIERQISIYEVTLAQGIILERNRVGLRNLLRKYWKDIDAAFIAYHRPETPNWRFTYVSELTGYDADGEFVKIKTEPKRYTYVLGEGESTRTAAERFTAMATKGSKATLDDVKEAFSVEKLSKAFFDEYKKHYDIFCDFMVSKPNIRQTIFNGDEKGIRDFNKKLLGRIVFLYFIQKKGWLGVPAKSDWGKGDFDFLTNLFKNSKNPDLFYSELLSKLFFDTLNTKRKDDLIELVKGEPCRIPYLNGGLFEEDDKKHRNLNYPANLFKSLFDFFNQYNFTIYEDDPNDHTVAVDPEMLGHIFENLLEDNKDKGAYYTPKEIVHYMCQESIIEYLCNALKVEPEDQERIAVSNLLKKKEVDKILKPEINNINSALDSLKVCDPAIGSGAFPMGLLHEIFTAKQTLHTFEHGNTKTFDASAVKLNIIQNSIYGVDIEKGAVDIARLRFWLSLIVDEEKPKALPNLDYKIVGGNSLVSKLGNDIIDIDWALNETAHGLFGAELAKKKGDLLKKISKEQKEFFRAEDSLSFAEGKGGAKKKLAAEIRNLKIDLLITQLELMVKTRGIETKPNGTSKILAKQTELYLQTVGWKNSIKDLQKLKNKPELHLQFFDWKLDFPEVMNEQVTTNIGFDIVIGNPPYVDYRLIESAINRHSYFPINKSSLRPNLYQYFVELSDSLLSDKGTFCFINPNQFLSTDNGLKLREHLIENRSIKFIVDVSYLKVFKEASTYTIIWLFNKNIKPNNEIRINRCSEINKISETSFLINQSDIKLSESKIIPINYEYFALAKIEKDKDSLGNISKLKWGTSATGYGQKKIYVDTYNCLAALKQKLYKPILQTSDTKKYYIDWQGEYIPINIYSDSIIREFNKTKIVIGRVTKQIQACLDEDYCFVGKSTLITDSKLNLKLLLSILNSAFANRWYYLKFETTHMAGGYLRFDIPYLEKLPIPKISKKTETKLINLTDKIISKKKQDIASDTTSLEKEIDHLVYKLYELTYDEVKVIDPAFSLSKKVYEAIKLE